MKIVLASPRGFCAGVDRAITIVEKALEVYGAPVYVRHEIVHNQYVCDELRQKGAIFVEETNEVPAGAVLVFSAHGVSPLVREEAEKRMLRVIDATCPLVTKVHLEAVNYYRKGYSLVLIGHIGHQEVIGTMGEAPMHLVETIDDVDKLQIDADKILYLTQTTLSVNDTAAIISALRIKYPQISAPPREDICYATTNRQHAVKELAKRCNLVLVVGSYNSSNSNRLVDTANASGVASYLVPTVNDVKKEWFVGVNSVGISSGASVPEVLVREIVEFIQQNFGAEVMQLKVVEEHMHFPLPIIN